VVVKEKKWLKCKKPEPMLDFLDGIASERKLRLFACFCCRQIWDSPLDKRSKKAVEIAERYADHEASKKDLRKAESMAKKILDAAQKDVDRYQQQWDQSSSEGWLDDEAMGNMEEAWERSEPAYACWLAASEFLDVADAIRCQELVANVECPGKDEHFEERCACFLRDIFGNPFRPVTLDSTWLTLTVTALAQAIYTDRSFSDMPILGDCLEEAGCNNAEILNHLRGPGPHCRGCWPLDLILGKS
jgi:hypothetical protein